jgi:hypothetical protein
MKIRSLLLLIAASLCVCTIAKAQVCATCPSFEKSTVASYKKLSALVGCWRGKGPNSLAVKVTYQLLSDKTALLETMLVEDNPTMLTVYYLDGETAVANHYCSYGNQLKMRAQLPLDPNVLFFKFVDGANMKGLDDNHMTYIKFMFRDEDHFDAEWGLHNRKDMPQPFNFRRVAQGCSSNISEW